VLWQELNETFRSRLSLLACLLKIEPSGEGRASMIMELSLTMSMRVGVMGLNELCFKAA